MIRQQKWVRYQEGSFTSSIQTVKGSGEGWIPVVYLGSPRAGATKEVKVKNEDEEVCYVVFVPKHVPDSVVEVRVSTTS